MPFFALRATSPPLHYIPAAPPTTSSPRTLLTLCSPPFSVQHLLKLRGSSLGTPAGRCRVLLHDWEHFLAGLNTAGCGRRVWLSGVTGGDAALNLYSFFSALVASPLWHGRAWR